MKITAGITDLALTPDGGGAAHAFHAALLEDEDGLTLVDTGLPGMYEQLETRIVQAGLKPETIRRILFTHQDADHIGTLPELLQRLPHVEVWAHADERPYLEGEKPLIKLPPQTLIDMPPQRREPLQRMLDTLVPGRVTSVLAHGELLPLQGGIRVLHTPGHTPGHISLYVPGEKLLLAGDAMRVSNGELELAEPRYTQDMDQAVASLKQLLDLEIDRVLCYHGGLFEGDVRGELRRLTTR
ncbi:MBL fold metallo-hydrolase [Saccharibacillus brassicae]|uniref:MBL fold metallo-hydrolase n=1 Tax=Saccharibacillus brassicae TaxID=2583377 RepID=A0A4Y6V1F5_SACBS|nr:MBL fold metallo-hydrolase [Saccharibacillus brassicae]